MDDKIEQVSLMDLINILIKRKKIIAITTIVFILLGLLQTFVISENRYASELMLEINDIESTETQSTGGTSAVHRVLDSITNSGNMDFDAYLNELTSEEVLEKTIEDLNLEDEHTTSSLENNISISSDSELKSINIRVTSGDPEKAAMIANKLAENFIEHITEISQENSLNTLEIIKKQMEIEREKYSEALEEYKKESQDSKSPYELELEIQGVYEQLTLYKLNLNDLNIKRDGIVGALEKTSDSSNNEAMVLRPGEDEGYIYLGSGKEGLETELAETEARIESTEASITDLQEDVEALQDEYQDVEFTESVIRQKLDLTKESYEAFAQKYQELNMSSSMDVGGISISKVSEAVPSNNPIGTRKPIKIALFTMIGLMTGIILSFFIEYLTIMRLKKSNKG